MAPFISALRGSRGTSPGVPADVARSIAEFAHVRFAERRGGTVFLAGGPGAGQGLVFDQLPHFLAKHRRSTLLLRGSVVSGIYIPAPQRAETTSSALSVVADLTTWLAPVAGPLGPLSPLLGQLISSVNDVQRLHKEFSSGRSSTLTGPRLLQKALRAIADQRPLCLAIESTAPGPLWWTNLIESLSIEADVDLRIMTIVGIEGPPDLPSNEDVMPDLLQLARSLIDDRRAGWLPMPTLDDAAIEMLIGPSAVEVREALIALTDGQAGRVTELFQEWRRQKVIVRNQRRMWAFDHTKLQRGVAPVKDIVDDRIQEAIGTDRQSLKEIKRFLVVAALQGEVFALEPIVELLNTSSGACERIVDRLTRNDDCGRLLEPVSEILSEPIQGHTPRYRFTDRWIWYSLERYGLSEIDKPKAAIRCARSLEQIYAADPAPIAYTLVRLYNLAGDAIERERWRHIAELSPSEDQLRWQAQAVIEDTRRWSSRSSEEARSATDFLLQASVLLSRMRPRHELWPLLEAVEKIASIHHLTRAHAKAVRFQGKMYAADGRYDRAREKLDTAERLLQELDEASERADLFCDLAYVEKVEGHARNALRRLDQAIAACDTSLDGTRVEARARHLRGEIALERRDTDRAQDDLMSATSLFRDLGDVDGVNASLTSLGATQVVQGDIDSAIASLSEAISIAQSTGNKANELYSRQYLGALVSDDETAYSHHERALVLARDLNDAPAEADSLLSLARSARALQRRDEAAHLLQEAFDLKRRLKDSTGIAWCLLEMGTLQISVGVLPRARKNLEAAQERFAAENIREGLGLTHHALGNVAAILGDRQTAKRELEIATGFGVEGTGRMVIVSPRIRPRHGYEN
jgi:tetratricopeptide (TPR) repeat protein